MRRFFDAPISLQFAESTNLLVRLAMRALNNMASFTDWHFELKPALTGKQKLRLRFLEFGQLFLSINGLSILLRTHPCD
jgi:hypothetical protein